MDNVKLFLENFFLCVMLYNEMDIDGLVCFCRCEFWYEDFLFL